MYFYLNSFIKINLYLLLFSTSLFLLVRGAANNLHLYDSIRSENIIGTDVFFEIIEPNELEYTYRLRPAKNFGTTFAHSNFKGERSFLVETIPADACSEIVNYDDIQDNIALVSRGECSFISKAINVAKIGARAIIVTELDSKSPDFDNYIEMIHDNSDRDVDIPAGFLIGRDGQVITRTFKKLRRNYAIINLPVNLTFTPAHLINHPPWSGW